MAYTQVYTISSESYSFIRKDPLAKHGFSGHTDGSGRAGNLTIAIALQRSAVRLRLAPHPIIGLFHSKKADFCVFYWWDGE